MKKNIRIFAFLLALVMAFSLTGCTIPSADSNPSGTNPSVTISFDMHQVIAQLISRLEASVSTANANYQEALDVLTGDFAAKPEGLESPQYIALKEALQTTKEERLASLSDMIATLQETSRGEITDITNKVAQVEALLSENLHTYGEAIYHSRNSDGLSCSEAEHYQICTTCNALRWTTGQHALFYSRMEGSHQVCCKYCGFSKDAVAHTLSEGQCTVCKYVENANILVIEGTDGDSSQLCNTISNKHTVTVVNTADSSRIPTSPEALQTYHEVILCNVAYADLPDDFSDILQIYVQELGGSLFTVGGDKAYQTQDMGGTTYADMLPVELQRPSLALVILIDVSGSMLHDASGVPYAESKLAAAKQAAEACLDELGEQDYVCIMPITDYFDSDYEMIPRTQRDKIVQAIEDLYAPGGGTSFSPSLQRAGMVLNQMTNVDKKHIIMITDGEPDPRDYDAYTHFMQDNATQGITTSIVGIQCARAAISNMAQVLKEYAGMDETHIYDVQDLQYVDEAVKSDLSAPALREMIYQRFMPSIMTENSITANISVENMPILEGAYSNQLKDNATEVLSSPYGPLYAQWQYGEGMVGSFMCDLNGTWSAEFLTSETGTTILLNIISHLINENIPEEEVALTE